MPTLRRFTVVPRLPANLERLREIAHNLWWAWEPDARELFVRIDPDLWEDVHGNPIELLSRVGQQRLDELSADDAFVTHLESAYATYQHYMSREGWFAKRFPEAASARIAYFSMEYGLHQSLPIYSGGLGVLAGDHLKTASDLGIPLVGVGLAYAEGYFRQVLNDDGWQGERYPINDWHRLPVQPVLEPGGKRLIIRVAYPQGIVTAQLWRVQVGRVQLFLLDSNLEENSPADRQITGPLYGGDQEFRVRQEIMLGIGGVHALEAVGLPPTVCHMNEGHSAFLALERIARVMREKGTSFQVASEACSAGNIFTTHTPVPAGNDAFQPDLVRKYLEPYRAALGISEDDLLSLGRVSATEKGAPFSMPVLAIHTADHYNGVSALHGEVSRKMWRNLWPDLPDHEIPIHETGQYVQAGYVMATLLRSDPMLLRFQVEPSDAPRLKPGMTAVFTMRETLRSYSAKISLVAGSADVTTHMVPVTAELTDAEHKYWLRPGSFCDVVVTLSGDRISAVIPRLATRATDHGYVAYVVEGDVAKERVLTLGMNTKDGWVEVRSGLAAGDVLVVRGGEALTDGAKVKTTRVTPDQFMVGVDAGGAPEAGGAAAGDGTDAPVAGEGAHKGHDGGAHARQAAVPP